MIKCIKITIFTLLCYSCSSELLRDEDIEELTTEPFKHISKCISITQEIFNGWKENGGSIKSSISLMRSHILNDGISDFSQLVKSAWQMQEENGFHERKSDLGSWPVNDNSIAIVFESYLFSDINIFGDCSSLSMWNEIMSEEFIIDNNEMQPVLLEFPDNILWKYPDNMLWMKYWIFANVK